MNILDEPSIITILKSIALNANIPESECEFTIDKGADKGDGYLSQMSLVQITSKNTKNLNKTDNTQQKINVIIKCAQRNPIQRTTFPLHQLYLRETRFYEEILPAFTDFQKKNGVAQPFNAVPKFYASCVDDNKEFLIMENIKLLGYELWDRKQPLDGVHTKLVLENYAKFHAVSFVMKQKQPKLYEKLSAGLDNLFVPKYVDRGFFQSFELAMDKAIGLFKDHVDQKYYEKLSDFKNRGKILQFFNLVGQTTWENPVITHGDSWLNNFMFKYQDFDGKKQLQDVKIVDFQIMRHVSVVLDIGYVIYMNTDYSLYNNYEEYLKFYYKKLSQHASAMGVNIEGVLPYASLHREWAKYCVYGLLFGLIGVGILLQDKDDIIDLSDISSGEVSAANVFFVDNNSSEGIRRMKNLVIHFVDHNFI